MSPASATAIEPEPPAAPTRRASRPIELTGSFDHEGHRLWYTEFGSGEKVVVLTHGIMLTRRMHAPLARLRLHLLLPARRRSPEGGRRHLKTLEQDR